MLATYMPRMRNNNLEIRIEGPLVARNNKVFRSPQTVVQCLDLVVWVLLGLILASCMNYMCLMWYFKSHHLSDIPINY